MLQTRSDVLCDLLLLDSSTLGYSTLHYSLLLDKMRFSCCDCRQSFSSKRELRRHERVHIIRPSCEHCGALFETKRSLKAHIKALTGRKLPRRQRRLLLLYRNQLHPYPPFVYRGEQERHKLMKYPAIAGGLPPLAALRLLLRLWPPV